MNPAPAQIGFGAIRHVRLRPARHAFAYGGFFLRLPVRRLGEPGVLPRGLAFDRAGLFSLHTADHGDGRPWLEWINELLTEAGVRDADGELWLHTFPRVLGYVFNPVSFWFAHRADGSLRAVVAEVNNTFGGRHAYVLAHADGRAIAWGEELSAAKAFHVSPFCRVEGRYRFRFMLAGPAHEQRFVARISHDDAAGELISTAIAGRLEPLSQATLRRAFWRYPLFTLGVIARIHWQALRLIAKRVPFLGKNPIPLDPAHPTSP